MLSTAEIIHFLQDNKSLLEEHYHCSEIGIFGSFARNEQTEVSDIDFLVVFKPGTPNLYDVELEMKEFLMKQFNRQVDICAEKWINPLFKPLVLKEAVYA